MNRPESPHSQLERGALVGVSLEMSDAPRFSTIRQTEEQGDGGSAGGLGFDAKSDASRRYKRRWLAVGFCVLASMFPIIFFILVWQFHKVEPDPIPSPVKVQRIAFGSCTQKGYGNNLIWEQAVVPAKPDAWIWLGDLAYMDITAIDCELPENSPHPDCQCPATWLSYPPTHCFAGDIDHAREKARHVIDTDGYAAFLEYMCPGGLAAGMFPPLGRDPAVCPRPILGTYDDHDYGADNGNRRLPRKDAMKQVFLDAIGEFPDSIRRSSSRGIYDWTTLNSDNDSSQHIDVILLDERYDRAPLPCHTRRQFCKLMIAAGKNATSRYPHGVHWCTDFIGKETVEDPGSCCKRDDDVQLGWCTKVSSQKDSRFESACDFTHPDYGTINWAVDDAGSLVVADVDNWRHIEEESGFCEVLGKKQRSWMDAVLQEAKAPVQLIVSGSVLFGAPTRENTFDLKYKGYCSGDDWDCYRPAQVNLLHKLDDANGCVIILTGDYHNGDIKRVLPGETDAPYAKYYETSKLKRPIYQVMGSGMSEGISSGLGGTECGDKCCGWHRDDSGLRGPGNKCAVRASINFGMLDFDWEKQEVTMKVMDGHGGGAAKGVDGSLLQLTISLKTCLPV